jgi:predicted Zn-dependent peptidase
MTVQITTLANGMRVVTHAMPHLETVSLGVWVGVGARSEAVSEHGISHLLEHMAFKGTARRSARGIAEEIESVGGDLNAATSPETTAFYARVLKGDIALALDIVSDILLHPRYDPGELAREKDVILQEIAAAQDSPDEIVFDIVQDLAYPDQPVGRPILGTAESVTAFTPTDLESYLRTHYSPGSMVLAAAGAVDHAELVRLAEAAFSDCAPRDPVIFEPARYVGGIRCGDKPFEQCHILLSFEGPSYRDEAFYASQLLSTMLGGGMSSRLFQEARESRGLCYSIYSYCWGMVDTGLFGVHAATGEDAIPSLISVINSELERIAETAPDAVELARSKAQLKTGLLMSLENSGARAEQLARQLLAYGQPLAIDDLIAKVENVSSESVRAQAEAIFTGSTISAALVGAPGKAGALDALSRSFRRPASEAAE